MILCFALAGMAGFGQAVKSSGVAGVPDQGGATVPGKPGSGPKAMGSLAPDSGEQPVTLPPHRDNFDLTTAQVERFQKFLPKAYSKLSKRQPLHIVAIGDSIVDMYMYDEAGGDWLKGYPAAFGKELATQFYYTGDLRIIRPNAGKLQKDRPFLGPEITLRSLGRGGKTMIHAMQTLTTHGFENPPDVVTVSFGINDSISGLNLGTYARAIQEVIDTVRSQGAELILLGPSLTVDEPPEVSMALTRPYSDTMREIAADNSVFFVDLGDLDPIVKIPEEVGDPGEVFDQVVTQYRRFFDHGQTVDFIHPRPELHRQLGKRIFNELVNGPAASPWGLSGGTVTFDSPEHCVVHYQITNRTEGPLNMVALPLVAGAWKPLDAVPQISLKQGQTKTVQVSYRRAEDRLAMRSNAVPSHEPRLRIPILFRGGGMTRIEEVRAEIRPFTLLWKLATLFNQERSFALDNVLVNTSADTLTAAWSVEWMGQKKSGEVTLKGGERKALDIAFDLPPPAAPWRQTAPLLAEIKSSGLTLRFDRSIEISRNLGLKRFVTLSPATSPRMAPSDDVASSGRPTVRLKADADSAALYLTYEISGINLEDNAASKGRGAFGYELSLDGRSFGKRLGFGAADSLRLNGNAADGTYPFGNPQPWTFGTGYAALFDPQHIRGQLSSGAGGIRRFTVTLPRSYLYLHEWALGNGNSQLGINTAMMFWKGPREGVPTGDYPDELYFSLLNNGRHRDDTEGFAVLELTDKPTARWTVNPF